MNYYGIYPFNDYRYYLQHNGVLGQKWGVRNGPPYPLKANQHSASEKRAGWQKSVGSFSDKESTNTHKPENDEGFVVPLALLAAKKVKQHIDTIDSNRIREEVIHSRPGKIDKETGFNKRTDARSPYADMENVNPGYKKNVASLNNNCVSCTMAFELRRRGFDVISQKSDIQVSGMYLTLNSFKDAKPKMLDKLGILEVPKTKSNWQYMDFKDKKNWKNIWVESSKAARKGKDIDFSNYVKDSLKKEKNSRGSLFVQWGAGGGHALSYEVKSGKVTIFDPQINKFYRTDSEIDKVLSHAWTGEFVRLDNLELNTKEIKKHVA